MDIIQYITTQFSTNQFFSAAVLGGGALGILAYARNVPGAIFRFILSRTTTSVGVNSLDDAYPYFLRWLRDIEYHNYNKRFNMVSVYGKASNNFEIILSPRVGIYMFRHLGKRFILRCDKDEPVTNGTMGSKILERITIDYLGVNLNIAKNIIQEVTDLYEDAHKNKIKLYRVGPYQEWKHSKSYLKRSVSSIATRKGLKEKLIADVQNFLTKENEEWYGKIGIPYRRNYLLHGLPGTGKTSMVYTIASITNMPLYCLSFGPTITDENFISLCSDIPEKSILVIEDVDSLFDEERNKKGTGVSFSTFINVLDGLHASHGRLVFLTTNHIDRLDQAIIRPGRINMSFEFLLCDKSMAETIFLNIHKNAEMAREFASNIKDDTISPAKIQEHLILYKNRPQEAIDDIRLMTSQDYKVEPLPVSPGVSPTVMMYDRPYLP